MFRRIQHSKQKLFRLSMIAVRVGSLALLLSVLSSCQPDAETDEVGKAPAEPPPKVLTEEEKKLNQILDDPEVFTPVQDVEEEPAEEPFVLNKDAQVSVLCYHDFSAGPSSNPMIMEIGKFREQMQAIRDADIPVITMADFLAWRRGEINVPDPCILITIDDGWKAVHTLALPIFQEFGFPFTIYLYKNYVDMGGRSLSLAEIAELRESGGTIGSHSVTHSNMADQSGMGSEEYLRYLHRELGESKKFLLAKTAEDPSTFAYPFGKYSEEAIKVAEWYGYKALFTVNGRRAKWDDPAAELGRFVVHGDNDYNFKLATSFRGRGNLADNLNLAAGAEDLPFDVFPEPESRVRTRLPEIVVDLSRMENPQIETAKLKVGGFGEVTKEYDPAAKTFRYQVPQKIRSQECLVQFSIQVEGESRPLMLPWRFYIDHTAEYLDPKASAIPEKVMKALPVAKPVDSEAPAETE